MFVAWFISLLLWARASAEVFPFPEAETEKIAMSGSTSTVAAPAMLRVFLSQQLRELWVAISSPQKIKIEKFLIYQFYNSIWSYGDLFDNLAGFEKSSNKGFLPAGLDQIFPELFFEFSPLLGCPEEVQVFLLDDFHELGFFLLQLLGNEGLELILSHLQFNHPLFPKLFFALELLKIFLLDLSLLHLQSQPHQSPNHTIGLLFIGFQVNFCNAFKPLFPRLAVSLIGRNDLSQGLVLKPEKVQLTIKGLFDFSEGEVPEKDSLPPEALDGDCSSFEFDGQMRESAACFEVLKLLILA